MKNKQVLTSLSFWFLLLLVWQGLFSLNLLNLAFFSSPIDIFNRVLDLNFWGLFLADLAVTFRLIWLGLVVGYILSYIILTIGILIPTCYRFISQINSVLKFLTPPILIPIGIVIFGINQNTKLFVPALSSCLLYLNYLIETVNKEEGGYNHLKTSWSLSNFARLKHFTLPITNNLNYRIIPAIVMWATGISLITEIVLGGDFGLGISLWRFQQLFDTASLYAYILLILLLAIGLEKILVWFFARLKWDIKKYLAGFFIAVFTIFSLFFQFNIGASLSPNRTILSYPGAVNLPIYVYLEIFNDLDFKIQEVASGIQVINGLQAGTSAVGGYADMPNLIAANSVNSNLKTISQLIETPDNPSLFFLSNKNIDKADFTDLNGATIGYYPNNPIIKSAKELVLLTRGVNKAGIEYVSSNDPNSLNQSLELDKIQALVTLEPFATDLEESLGITRFNPNSTIIAGISFERLPLAGLTINTDILSTDEINQLNQGIQSSLEFIRDNTTDNKPSGELIDIMNKYNLNPNSFISQFQSNTEINPEDLDRIISVLRLLNLDGIENLEPDQVYLD